MKESVVTIFEIIFISILLAVILSIAWFSYINSPTYEEKQEYHTYVVIFYPDMKKTIEGYVDKFNIYENVCTITINGVEYTVDSKNVIFTKKKDSFFKEEDECTKK